MDVECEGEEKSRDKRLDSEDSHARQIQRLCDNY